MGLVLHRVNAPAKEEPQVATVQPGKSKIRFEKISLRISLVQSLMFKYFTGLAFVVFFSYQQQERPSIRIAHISETQDFQVLTQALDHYRIQSASVRLVKNFEIFPVVLQSVSPI